jgi:hypothetical protein
MTWVSTRWEVGASVSPTSHLPPPTCRAYTSAVASPVEHCLETHGPLGTIWVGLGLCAFYIALIWLNTLLGVFLTPLFIIPGTWLLEWLQSRRRGEQKARR